jgi:GNAT superfamily N-acetyltransferase
VTERVQLRSGTVADSEACWDASWESISDLAARRGTPWSGTAADHWPRFRSLFEHLAEDAVEWWVAEEDGRIIGYARSVERGDHGELFELAELFVRPSAQSGGIGRALLERAFPHGRGEIRTIIATTDERALARYYRSGTHVRFPILGMSREPRRDAAAGIAVQVEPITEATLDEVAAIDGEVLGYGRGDRELRWLLGDREGHLYLQDGSVVGFGFVSAARTGPIAARSPDVVPEILAHIEARAAALGADEVAFEVPTPNEAAMTHLVGAGYRFDGFPTYLMSNRPFGRFDRYVGFAPPFVL